MKRAVVAACIALAGCDARTFGSDEGVWLGKRIGEAAETLRASSDTMIMVEYSPRQGFDQRYTVGFGASKWCPHPPCDAREQTALTVSVERGHSGTTTVHKRHVAVPAPLSIVQSYGRTNVVLRKNGNVIEVVRIQ